MMPRVQANFPFHSIPYAPHMEWNGMENVLGLSASLLAGRRFKNPFKRLLKTPLVLGQSHTLSVMIDEGHLPTGKGQHLDFELK